MRHVRGEPPVTEADQHDIAGLDDERFGEVQEDASRRRRMSCNSPIC
jgi:hypothetical protein